MKQIEKYKDGLFYVINNCTANCSFCQFEPWCQGDEYKYKTTRELVNYLLSDVPENLLSDDEYVILKSLNGIYKWIARDADGVLSIFENEPEKNFDYWNDKSRLCLKMAYSHWFGFVRWEDNESYEIEKLLRAYEENKHEN